MTSGSLHAATFALLDKRLAEQSSELGSALDLQQLQLQARQFENMERLEVLLLEEQRQHGRVEGADGAPSSSPHLPRKAAALCSGLEGDALAEELGAIAEQLSGLREGQEEVKAMLRARQETKKGHALAKQDKQRALEKLEILLDNVETEAFARGGFGVSGQMIGCLVVFWLVGWLSE